MSAPRFRHFLRSANGYTLLALILLAVLAGLQAGLWSVLPPILGAVAAASAVDLVISLRPGQQHRWLFPSSAFPSSAFISGIIIGLILSPTEPWWVPVVTGALATSSKYLLPMQRGRLVNPAAFALLVSSVLFSASQNWWGALPALPIPTLLVLFSTGAIVTGRVNKFPQVLSFGGIYFLLFTLAAFAGDASAVAVVFRKPFIHAALFFAFFMLTEPKTSTGRYSDQVLFGAIVAVASFAAYLAGSKLTFLLIGLLMGNIWAAWRRGAARHPATNASRVLRPLVERFSDFAWRGEQLISQLAIPNVAVMLLAASLAGLPLIGSQGAQSNFAQQPTSTPAFFLQGQTKPDGIMGSDGVVGTGGMVGSGGSLGGQMAPTVDTPIGQDQAVELARQFLDSFLPGTRTGEVHNFYGYRTIYVEREGQVQGVLSVNGFTGAVWYHTWHGELLEQWKRAN